MERIKLNTTVNAPPERIWRVLWDDASYRDWTSAFCEGSYARTDDWREGSRVHFLTPEGSGMFSRIVKHEAPRIMEFEHLGSMKNGEEQPQDEDGRKWAGAREIYRVRPDARGHVLEVELDVAEEHAEMMRGMFDTALARVKQLAEEAPEGP